MDKSTMTKAMTKPDLNFDQTETKNLLTQYDLGYFLQRNIAEEGYDKSLTEKMFESYRAKQKDINKLARENSKQANLYMEGLVRDMFNGGFLPSFLGLIGTKQNEIFFPPHLVILVKIGLILSTGRSITEEK